MAAIQWESKYEVGIPVIDKQHKKIVKILNRIYGFQDRKPDEKKMQKIFDDLKNYIETHFETEEKYISEHNSSGIDEQKHEHGNFIDTICTYQKDFLKQNPLALINLFNFVWDWFAHHILVVDKKWLAPGAQQG